MKSILLIAISFLMVSCGPMYSTRYRYTDPTTQEGLKCVNGCIRSKSSCNNQCSQIYNSCNQQMEERARNDYNQYLNTECYTQKNTSSYRDQQGSRSRGHMNRERFSTSITEKKCRGNKTLDSFRSNHCNNDKNNCTAGCRNDYDSCYTNCGGLITSYQVCVAFCNQN